MAASAAGDEAHAFSVGTSNNHVVLTGEIDLAAADDLRRCLAEATEAASNGTIIVDVTRAELMDSTALGVLVGGYKRLKGSHGDDVTLVIRDPCPRVARLLEVTGLDQLFSVEARSP